MSELETLTKEFEAAIVAIQRQWIAEHLAMLTVEQQDLFRRLYPNGPTKSQIFIAAEQIERTIKRNKT